MPTIWEREPDNVITTYLGQFDRVMANAIAARLEEAGITWWYKEPSLISAVWEFGVRLFVDRERLDRAKAIVEEVRSAAPHHDGPGEAPAGT
jgi:Putative prokaryotic signal transducing protein